MFPLVIGLTISGFTLMVRWYSQWEKGLEQHREMMETDGQAGNLRILYWEQWNQLWEDEPDEKE